MQFAGHISTASAAVDVPTMKDAMLAVSFTCDTCQQDLSHVAFEQRVAHMKKCMNLSFLYTSSQK